MKYVRFGNSELSISRICIGCMGFGDAQNGQHSWTLDEEHSREIIKRGLELGVNFYDTAIGYQSRTQEEIESGIGGQQHIERMINKSLENLGMDYVALHIYHM